MMWIVSNVCVVGGEREPVLYEACHLSQERVYLGRVRPVSASPRSWTRVRDKVWCSASLTFLLLAWQVKQLITATKYRKWRASFRKARQPGHLPAPVTHSALPLRPPSGRPLSGDSVESKPNHGAWLYISSLWIIFTSILLYCCIYVYLWIPSNYRIIAAA